MSKVSFIILIFVSVKIIRLEEQLIIKPFLDNLMFEVVRFLKLGPIFLDSRSSERKSNHKNNYLVQIFWEKSPFGWAVQLCAQKVRSCYQTWSC